MPMTKEDMESNVNRGKAAKYREIGQKKNVPGFEKGGDLRKKANAIVHAEPGDARNKTADVKQLSKVIEEFK